MSSLATSAQLNRPNNVFVSSNNEVYIADCFNNRIRKILENGTIVTIAGNGTKGSSGDNGLATNAQLNRPYSVFVSSNNEVYIADQGNNRIRKILENGNIITIAGNGIHGFSGDNGLATNAQLYTPCSVFVSSNNEVYIADQGNHRIRKILENGNIVTIAGNGIHGFSGDNGLATNAQLNSSYSVFVSSNNEVYIADYFNNRIRKILENGNIITIAGNGTHGFNGDNENGNIITIAGNGIHGFNGDNGLATNARLNHPFSVFVSSNNEVYIADYYNNRIRKILENGNIITIAGNGTAGFSGDSPFDIRTYPHIGNKLLTGNGNLHSKIEFHNLKKHSRDELFGLPIYGFIPLIEKTSPKFSNILKNEKLLCLMSSSQEIIQKLIDSLMYDKNKVKFSKEEILDVLFILGLFKNGEFIDLKRSLTSEFVNSLTLENLTFKWETIENLLKICNEEFNVQNYILDHLNNYCIEYAVVQMRTKKGNTLLPTLPIIMRNATAIFSKMIITQPTAINIEETIETEPQIIESLYNDKKTSDVKIKMGQDKYLYCHKTILTSFSTLFNALFDSGSCFSDLSDDGIFTPDESEDLELLEIVIKYCYGISTDKIDDVKIIGLLDMAMKHEIQYLVDYCKNNFNLSIDNYFTILEACEKYLDLQSFEQFLREIVKFSITNRKQLFRDHTNRIYKLPEKVCQEMLLRLSQDF
ncbi:predicted protein [Naegleria gruberi]|uniref:Predicted protein n=1 Tax=Naegleria gruberi TaxID=5762 RepID=D2V6E4_NAEGR|nr:uncharacterized protein NAEGRDRAFT_64406 [Naegleria gruberi]EFC47557.1 predicted protein [Naegleria gruberi]|eukprot:XP_002680301.1 predicted protein [Naegleria gruberi strain NEG-M]